MKIEKELYPADRLIGMTLKDGWTVTSKIGENSIAHSKITSCYIVQKKKENGFLKAFDYRDLKKHGGHEKFRYVDQKIKREIDLLKKCNHSNIKNVVSLLVEDEIFLKEGDINEKVMYYILEYSLEGNIETCLQNDNLINLTQRFYSLSHVFDGIYNLHKNEIYHLDIKTNNLIYFREGTITKIADFGSARQFLTDLDEDVKQDIDNIFTTRQCAPPEYLYFETFDNWSEGRRKMDLYLLGNVIVKFFTNVTFTSMLKNEISSIYDWNTQSNHGNFRVILPYLTEGYITAVIKVQEILLEINHKCGNPLTQIDVNKIISIIKELCHPDPLKRGIKKAIAQSRDYDGLDRYRDMFVTLAKKSEYRLNKPFKF